MAPLDTNAQLSAAIRNAAWMVRHYQRGRRIGIGKLHRDQAIVLLGVTVREAFNASDNFEPLLEAIVDGLRPLPDRDPF